MKRHPLTHSRTPCCVRPARAVVTNLSLIPRVECLRHFAGLCLAREIHVPNTSAGLTRCVGFLYAVCYRQEYARPPPAATAEPHSAQGGGRWRALPFVCSTIQQHSPRFENRARIPHPPNHCLVQLDRPHRGPCCQIAVGDRRSFRLNLMTHLQFAALVAMNEKPRTSVHR